MGRGHKLDKVDRAWIFFSVRLRVWSEFFLLLLPLISFFPSSSLLLSTTNKRARTVVRAQDQRLPETVEGRLELWAEHVDEVRPLFFLFFSFSFLVSRQKRSRRV